MIHPLTRMTVRAFLWYQGTVSDTNKLGQNVSYKSLIGEANTKSGKSTYACLFKKLIKTWREIWHERTAGINDIAAPFGFVQIGDKDPTDQSYSFPVIRWEQMRNLPVGKEEEGLQVRLSLFFSVFHDI